MSLSEDKLLLTNRNEKKTEWEMKKSITWVLLSLSAIVTYNPAAYAVGSTGFENASFSSYSLGQANAVVAQADEPATISYNPAGIVQLPGIQAQSNLGFVSSFTFYDGEGRGQSDTQSTGTIIPFPTAYFTVNPGRHLGNRVALGVGSDSPFGLAKKYESTHPISRYTGYDTWLEMYTIKPVISVKVTEKLLVGAGPMYYRIMDFGGVLKYPNALAGGAGTPDGQARLNLSGNDWGWHFGVLAKPHPKHQLGYYFRSPVTVTTTGLVKVENSLFSGNGGRIETGGSAKIDLPLNMTWAYAYKWSDKTTVEVDFGFTRWAAHKRLYIDAAPTGSAADNAILAAIGKNDKNWRNSFTVHLGGNHQVTKKLQLLAGSYWTTAAAPKTHFIPAVPDSNRVGFSVGFNYDFTRNFSAGANYLALIHLRRKINNSISEVLGTSVDGKYFTYTQDFMLSFTYKWDDVFDKRSQQGSIAGGPAAVS